MIATALNPLCPLSKPNARAKLIEAIPSIEPSKSGRLPSRYMSAVSGVACPVQLTSTRNIATTVVKALMNVIPIPIAPAKLGKSGLSTGVE